MLADLSRDHCVIAWDAPGLGDSSETDDSWRPPQFADTLAAFVAALGLERPHPVGHSFGTMVALSLFRRHSRCAGESRTRRRPCGLGRFAPPNEVARRLEMFVGMAELGNAFDPKSYPGLFSGLIPADRDTALVTMMREDRRPATIRAAGHIGAETDLRPVLPTIDVPTLVLHGGADAPSPLANAEALHAATPPPQRVVLPKLGHACVVEDPEACAAEIRRYVKTVTLNLGLRSKGRPHRYGCRSVRQATEPLDARNPSFGSSRRRSATPLATRRRPKDEVMSALGGNGGRPRQ
jgi:pimeloyl-ACP methyl ester carboxylesterase